jgi:hypothetical protein
MTGHYNVRCSSFIALKCRYFCHHAMIFKNSVAVEIELLHSQPFMKSHIHLLIIVDCAKTGQLCQCSRGLQ